MGRSPGLVLVASLRDAQSIGRPYVLADHGAGQTYAGHERNGSYPGGEGHDRCVLFLCPSQRVADLWRERYPDTPAVVVGCPRLDRYADRRDEQPRACPTPERAGSPTPSHIERANATDERLGQRVSPPIPGSTRRTGGTIVVGRRPEPVTGQCQKRSEASSPQTRGDGALVPPPSRLDLYNGESWRTPTDGVGRRVATFPGSSVPTVAVTFHADLAVCPETHSAWRYYDPHLPRLVRDPRFRVVGHGHPRLWPTVRRRWEELGVDQWPDVDQVLSEADVLVVDNSSVAFEFAAIGKPVVLLNIPSYRREVESGGRFWTSPPGIQCDHPSELADTICRALTDPPAHRAIRARAVEWAYGGPITGDASERAAAAIMEVLDGH